MKTNKYQSIWIIICSCLYMAKTCGQATLKRLFKTITRQWCDEELQRWANRMINLFKINLKIINNFNTNPKKNIPTIIMCNHASLLDIPLSLLAFPNCSMRMLAKKELSKIPIMGQGMIDAEFPFIDRMNKKQAIIDLSNLTKLLESGIVLWIAPEGTRSKNGKLGKFKKGGFITAIQTKAKIIPIGIRNAHNILPTKTLKFNLNQTAEIYIGEEIDASKYELDQKEELITKVFNAMSELITIK